jgi:MFS family permease
MYSQSYKHYVTTLLLAVYVCSYVDRQILALLMQPIKGELQLSDTQLGFLAGPAFVLFYSILGIPIARLADRSSRVKIISVCAALWSVMTMLCGVVGNFWHLALARAGVGIGEAGCTPPAQSLIADYFSPAERTRALSIYMLGIPLGVLVGYLLGGWINQAYGWRAAFWIVGLPGVILALLVKWSIKEPPRSQAGQAAATAHRPPLQSVLITVWRRRALRHLVIGMTLVNIVSASTLTWLPTFFVRQHGMTTGELGSWLALMIGVGGSVGTWLGGYLTTRYGAQDERIQLRLLAVSAATAVPLLLLVLLCPDRYVALLVSLPGNILLFFLYGPFFSLVHGLCDTNLRATTVAVVMFILVLFAGVVGAQSVGLLSDALGPVFEGGALRAAMAIVSLMAFWGAAHFWWATRFARQDVFEASGSSGRSAYNGPPKVVEAR